MITIIAEKPSVAREIAAIVGASRRLDGYLEGNGYCVTWALGHLLEICPDTGESWDAPLPVLPERFLLRIPRRKDRDGRQEEDPSYARQLKVIGELFSRSECIINAGDAGREGELIQRYIYDYLGCSVPVKRLWISSLTDDAIRDGLAQLRPSSEFDSLYMAGKARSEADWLVGINATRALTKAAGDGRLLSLGRVQTPTMALVCRRFLENRDFVPVPFWNVTVKASLAGDEFSLRSDVRYPDLESAQAAETAVREAGSLLVKNVSRKDRTEQPPLLHDLTSLQREANRRWSMSAQQTLEAAQSLYEKKLITYPRTGSRYVTEDVFNTFHGLLGGIRGEYSELSHHILAGPLNRRSVDDSKVTDHHAILPTGVAPGQLQKSERRIYDLVLVRLLEAVSPKCELVSTTVLLEGGGVLFTAKGDVVIAPGWKAVRGEQGDANSEADDDERPQTLPPFRCGDICPVMEAGVKEGKTKPRPLYTEASLLEAMEHAGREVEDETLRDALKQCGLGTPATRAGIIETIISRGYVQRSGKNLVATPAGLSIYESVKDMAIADVSLTAEWEQSLSHIEDGSMAAEEFDSGIRAFATKVTGEILSDGGIASRMMSSSCLPGCTCPHCGSPVLLKERSVSCTDPSCGFSFGRVVAGKTLLEKDVVSLLCSGRTMEMKGFRSKAGKEFAARLVLSEGKVTFEFVDHDADKDGNPLLCPSCFSPVHVYSNIVKCTGADCYWTLWRTVAGKTLTESVVQTLLKGGKTPVLKGFRSKMGKPFDAALRLSEKHEIEFVFPPKGGLKLKKR